ncbi:MAG: hypothetical protein ACP5O0_07870 [Acidimicrobiales bacterium]
MRRVLELLRSFVVFLWDFIIGDDIVLAIGVALGVVAIGLFNHALHHSSWWILPVVWVVALSWSLFRAVRTIQRAS